MKLIPPLLLVGLMDLAPNAPSLKAAPLPGKPGPGDENLANYFRAETKQLSDRCLTDIHSLAEWKARREQLRQELFEMLGLSPLPAKTDLHPVITGKLNHDDFTVEILHFQSMPGLYVTGNLYLPKHLTQPAPAILYVCGHAYVITNGVSFGNKTAYQHHGAWFARNGYVCLVIDTVQLGEIHGIHHGTYREGMWWWNARGYTPAGVEAWNSIRALDYLQSRPEVDSNRLGVTGRSGGGAYSWWVTALDDRIKCAAPVAGITDLQNHVVDGTVEGHCDCMFMVNTYRWDFPMVAALAAPRPLLIGNSDKDSIFPLDGVVRLHAQVAKIYELYGATNNLGLLITEGPHHDTQDLQLPVFRWFNRHLKGEDPLIEMAAKPFFTAQQLKVFDSLPADERTSKIHETFVPEAHFSTAPASATEWQALRNSWMTALREKVFRGWPEHAGPIELRQRSEQAKDGRQFAVDEFSSQEDVPLRLYVLRDQNSQPNRLRLTVLSEKEWPTWIASTEFSDPLKEEIQAAGLTDDSTGPSSTVSTPGEVQIWFAPRGIGLSAWTGNQARQTQIRRRFMLLGQTLDGMRVWDVRRAIQALRQLPDSIGQLPLTIAGSGQMGVNVLYAALFEPSITELRLVELPASHRIGPDYMNVLRFLDIPQAVAMAAEHCHVQLRQVRASEFSYPAAAAGELGWPEGQFRIEPN
jgi:dienelactone hydrolase